LTTHSGAPRGKFVIRLATHADLPAIVKLLADDAIGARRESADTTGTAPAAEYRLAFNAIDANPDELLVVGCVDNEVLATLQLTLLHHLSHRGAIRAQIESVRVASASRGQGMGHQLVQWALARARERGARLVQLSTDKTRVDAHRFYESLGFRATHEGMKLPLGQQ
jgi:ribosomal protein S18 acetylase RimI-like enzyme